MKDSNEIDPNEIMRTAVENVESIGSDIISAISEHMIRIKSPVEHALLLAFLSKTIDDSFEHLNETGLTKSIVLDQIKDNINGGLIQVTWSKVKK